MSAVYAATMAVLVRIWHWTARQVFAAEPIASALLPQMIAAVFGELFFLVFVPFSPAFFAALTLNGASAVIPPTRQAPLECPALAAASATWLSV